ncbi:MAG: phosphoribosylaminoimidazolesuccinocarboxamide synthase [Candidatus Marinimicrobia bacterium]|nr:phosphoribosylaminoimidazolesuccinocarboxamide synthase [Candidatus Neomarinimicrobiota bacterium]
MEKKKLLYEGKAKKIYSTSDENLVIQLFKDSATAGDGAKKGTIKKKGEVNNQVSSFLFDYLKSYSIPNHFEQKLTATSMLVKNLKMFKLEVVMRNIAAGSLVKKYAIKEGTELEQPILEYYLKDDKLHDPMISSEHAVAFELADQNQIAEIGRYAKRINVVLKDFLLRREILLVDFKLEFGEQDGVIYLGDEISPDTCRFWDVKSKKKLDKDRFRQDLGGVEEAYMEILHRVLG